MTSSLFKEPYSETNLYNSR